MGPEHARGQGGGRGEAHVQEGSPDAGQRSHGFYPAATVDAESAIQSDGWKAYQSLSPDYDLETVNHSKQLVKVRRGKKVHINSLEGCHGVVKRKARALNLLVGQPTKDGKALSDKLAELQFRFNNRSAPDLFLVFLSILVLKRYKGPWDQLSCLFSTLSL